MNATRKPYWTTLRAVGNSSVVKATILVPFVGYAIIFNDKLIEYLQVSNQISGGSSGVVSWRLVISYLGLSSIALGSIIYTLLCPEIIKKYDSAASYVREVGDHLSDFAFELMETELRDADFSGVVFARKDDYLQSLKFARTDPQRATAKRDYVVELMTYYFFWRNNNRKNTFWRVTCLGFYSLGFALLLIPSIDVFTKVVRILFKIISTQ